MTRSSFPALVIAPLLLVLCVFPGQVWLAHVLPGWSGRATATPGLILLDIPMQLPIPIDLILVPGLFLVLYAIAILIYTSREHLAAWPNLTRRLGAIVTSVLIILLCVGLGALLSFLVRDHLPAQVRSSLRSFAVDADLHLSTAAYASLPLRGDVFSLLGLVIGIVIGVRIMRKAPRIARRTLLTREQRMTPYQRMLQERVVQERHNAEPPIIHRPVTHNAHQPPVIRRPAPAHQPIVPPTFPQHGPAVRSHHYEPAHGLCHTEPLQSMQPQAVNYRPLV